VPQTTALRRIDDLAQANLIERVADPADRRRVYIRLKDDTVKKLDRYLQSFWSIASEAEPARRA
jgi:DNA-binding MarR family transcriptional regulator